MVSCSLFAITTSSWIRLASQFGWPRRTGRFRRGAEQTHLTVYFVSALTSLFGLSATAQADVQIDAFLATVNKSVVALAGRPESEASSICGQIVSSAINMDAVVKGASTHIWDEMSLRQQHAYRLAAQNWAVRDCVQRNRDNSGTPLEFVGLRQGEAGEQLLATRSHQPSHMLVWRLQGDKRLSAVDLLLDGRSMVLALRDQTNLLLGRTGNDIDKAIEVLGR
jgi:hypothetical protein